MLKELEYFIKYSIESKRPEFVSVLREEPRINYPWEAIRELAMNAVMHRAYNGNNSDVTVKAPAVILNSTESGTNVTNNVTNGMKRNNSGTTAEQSGTMCGTMSGTIRNNDDSLDNIQDLVLNQIRKDKRISIKQLSKMFNKTRSSMFRIIEKLKADGRLRRVGSLKSGTWEVIE